MSAQMALSQDDFFGFGDSMRAPLTISIAFHVLLFILATVGLPHFSNDVFEPEPIGVEYVTEEDLAQQKEKKEETPPKPVEEEKPKPQPKMTNEAPPDLNAPKEPEIVEEEDPAPAEPEAVPMPEDIEQPKTPIKPAPPKPEITKRAVNKQQEQFASLLKNLTPDAPEERTPETKDFSDLPPTPVESMSSSEVEALRRQLAGCWNVLAGTKYAENMVVEIRLKINPDMTVNKAQIVKQGANDYNGPQARAVAESALRALRNPNCSPLKLPPGKYEQWKDTIIRFDPKDML